jgi:EAL domain-containing protein (putative c-di-GMP-specific phosphodiesterase class I)
MQQAALLRDGCAEGQGYLYGKPMPAEEFARAFSIYTPLRRAAG